MKKTEGESGGKVSEEKSIWEYLNGIPNGDPLKIINGTQVQYNSDICVTVFRVYGPSGSAEENAVPYRQDMDFPVECVCI